MPTLDWLNRASAFTTAAKVPYRLLEQVSAHTSHAENNTNSIATKAINTLAIGQNGTQNGINTDNLLIQGDNLEALKALLPFYRGQVKCIFIDPPYNTKSAFEHYDDNLEHAQWLSLMLPRLQLLRELLREDGSIWVTIDDNEGHYLKVLMDEVFGRGNFVANVVWEKSDSPKMDSLQFSTRHDHLLVACKNASSFTLKRLDTEMASHYDKVDENGRNYYLKPLRVMGGQGDSRETRPNLYCPLIAPDGSEVYPKRTDGKDGTWRWIGIEMGEHAATHCLPRLQKVLDGEQGGISKTVNWTGGGAFRFLRLGKTVFDDRGRINPALRFCLGHLKRTILPRLCRRADGRPYGRCGIQRCALTHHAL